MQYWLQFFDIVFYYYCVFYTICNQNYCTCNFGKSKQSQKTNKINNFRETQTVIIFGFDGKLNHNFIAQINTSNSIYFCKYGSGFGRWYFRNFEMISFLEIANAIILIAIIKKCNQKNLQSILHVFRYIALFWLRVRGPS